MTPLAARSLMTPRESDLGLRQVTNQAGLSLSEIGQMIKKIETLLSPAHPSSSDDDRRS